MTNEHDKWQWQEPGGAWKGAGLYHITLTIPSREPLLGTLVIPDGDATQARVEAKELGLAVLDIQKQLSSFYPEIQILHYCLMPDHLHAVWYVRQTMPRGIRAAVRGFWQEVKKAGRLSSFAPTASRENNKQKLKKMKIIEKYKFGFDAWALGLFVLVMIPNLFWFGVPAPNDILRTVSVTPVTDTIGAVLQVLMIASLCMVKNKNAGKMQLSPLIIGVIACLAAYYTGWCLFYSGIVGKLVIGLLTLPPCIAFVLYATDRKNLPAILFASGFMLCHVVFGVVNYM